MPSLSANPLAKLLSLIALSRDPEADKAWKESLQKRNKRNKSVTKVVKSVTRRATKTPFGLAKEEKRNKTRRKMAAKSNQINRKRVKKWKN